MSHTTNTTTFAGTTARKMSPTKAHRPAMWENMLGTVYAMNDQRVTRYFDTDWEAAKAFAGITADRDPRVARKTAHVRYTDSMTMEPRRNQLVLWITK